MVKREEIYFDSRDNKNKIHGIRWIPEGDKPLCILQIIHGMAEYIGRYDEFAESMAEKGILVVGEDHLGHGKSVGENGTYGYFCEQDSATVVVRDSHRLKKMTQEKYPGVPYVVLGHSMGSFILRNYLCRYGTGIQGAVIVGTGMQPRPLLWMGKAAIVGKGDAWMPIVRHGIYPMRRMENWNSFSACWIRGMERRQRYGILIRITCLLQ